MIASTRRSTIASPKISAPPRMTQTGFRKPMAVTSATGSRAIAKNHSITATV